MVCHHRLHLQNPLSQRNHHRVTSSPNCLLLPSLAHLDATPRNRICLFNLQSAILPRNFLQRSAPLQPRPYGMSSSQMLPKSLLLLPSDNQNSWPCSLLSHRYLREQTVFPFLSQCKRLLPRADTLLLRLRRDQLPIHGTLLHHQVHQRRTRDTRPRLRQDSLMLVISPSRITT